MNLEAGALFKTTCKVDKHIDIDLSSSSSEDSDQYDSSSTGSDDTNEGSSTSWETSEASNTNSLIVTDTSKQSKRK